MDVCWDDIFMEAQNDNEKVDYSIRKMVKKWLKITFNVFTFNTGRGVYSAVNNNKPLGKTNSLDRRPENDASSSVNIRKS